jgi:hypothetical protein
MSDQIELYRRGHEAAEKLDYFICGVAGALFACIGQNYKPHKIEFGLTLIEPLALVLLAFAFFAGLKRIEMCNAATHINHEQLKVDEQGKELAKRMEASGEGRKMFEPQWAGQARRVAPWFLTASFPLREGPQCAAAVSELRPGDSLHISQSGCCACW